MLNKEYSEAASAMSSKSDVSEIYSIRQNRQNIRIKSPQNKTVTVSAGFGDFSNTLETFAPDGVPTISPEAVLNLVDIGSGRKIEFSAIRLVDVAALVSTFGIVSSAPAEPDPEQPASLPGVLFEKVERPLGEVPDWIASNPEFKPRLVIDDGLIVLDFTAVRMNTKSKYMVDGRCPDGDGGIWGYEVTAKGKQFGWVVLLDPGQVLVTGVEGNKHSKHRTVLSAMFRLSTYLQDD